MKQYDVHQILFISNAYYAIVYHNGMFYSGRYDLYQGFVMDNISGFSSIDYALQFLIDSLF